MALVRDAVESGLQAQVAYALSRRGYLLGELDLGGLLHEYKREAA